MCLGVGGAILAVHSPTREEPMPKVSKQTASTTETAPGYEGHFQDLGGYTAVFESYSEDADMAALFKGLPDDRCQCPHWGVVKSGQLVIRYADHDEAFNAGDAYYIAPGHLPLVTAGTEVIEFSPTDALQQTMAVVGMNMEAGVAVS